MRTTLDIEDSVLQAARGLVRQHKRSAGQVIRWDRALGQRPITDAFLPFRSAGRSSVQRRSALDLMLVCDSSPAPRGFAVESRVGHGRMTKNKSVPFSPSIEQAYLRAPRITVICDNARYYRCKRVRAYQEDSRIELIFLPSNSLSLNLVERFWEFFKRQVLYNRYYEAFDAFRAACKDFFANFDSYASKRRTLLTENFQIGRS
jgi:transposase